MFQFIKTFNRVLVTDLVRSSATRDVPSNMKMFPNDIVMAEHLTGGDPNILNSEAFAPEKKSDYKELFGTKKTSAKKMKPELLKKDRLSLKSSKFSPLSNGRKSLPVLPATVPRPITHPRFITKALEGKSDHEIRIRCQTSIIDEYENPDTSKERNYQCHLCDFHTTRINVIVLHNKSHSSGFMEAQSSMKAKTKAKSKDRSSLPSLSVKEKTPVVVTSRGRVKSLPKRLEDYDEEPPSKILREKVSTKGESSGSQKKPALTKVLNTPKKEKEEVDKKTFKRPLFGKKKSAKEKAELAAKIKQENDAMKEKLLLDWDDDDVNEEVELDELKKALESTTSSSTDLDDSKQSIDESESFSPSPTKMAKPKTSEVENKPTETKSDVKSTVFEFDDSEDSLPVNINFRPKKVEKFTDDKFKKPKPPKPLIRTSPKNKPSIPSPSDPTPITEDKEDKEDVEFNQAINAFLEETVIPSLPEIPKTCLDPSTALISDQTSDISSSTDLIDFQNHEEKLDPLQEVTNKSQHSEVVVGHQRMECTSSDSEEFSSSKDDLQDVKMTEDKKNSFDVSAESPKAEIDTDVMSGATTEIQDQNSSLKADDTTVTEISSTCDLSKMDLELSKISNEGDKVANVAEETLSEPIKEEGISQPHVKNSENSLSNNTTETNSYLGSIEYPPDLSDKRNLENIVRSEQLQESEVPFHNEDIFESEVVKEETIFSKNEEFNIKNEVNQDILSSTMQINQEANSLPQVSAADTMMSFQFVSSPGSETATVSSENPPVETSVGQVSTILEGEKTETQNISQNLQDMELDINSMPVIIGGEDFLPPELPKPSLVPIQPKYSESIVISPKTKTASTSKPVIMQVEGTPTTKQNVHSIISIPSKGGKSGGKGSRGQKATSKTIKLSASALKNLGIPQKAGNQQVLILKTTSGQDKLKGMTEKGKISLNMLQQGNKILIVNSPQLSGQNKIKFNSPQQIVAGGKLAPGTRVITSKVVPSSSQGASNKPSITSSSPSKPVQKLVISKGGILSNTSKGIIINNSGGKLVTTVTGAQTLSASKAPTLMTHNLLTTKGNLLLPSSSQTVSSSKPTTIITSQPISSSKSMIFTTVQSKGETIISGNQKLRIVSSKAPMKGTRLVVQNPQGKIAIDPQNKNQQVKLISSVGGQSSPNTIYIQTNQGIVAKSLALSSTISTQSQQNLKLKETNKILPTTASPTKLRLSVPRTKQQPQIIQPQIIQQAQIVQQPQIIQQTRIIKQPQVVQQQQKIVQQPQIIQQPIVSKPAPAPRKVTIPKTRQSPNILQKPPRKSTPRAPKTSVRSKVTQSVPTSDQLILSPTAKIQGINQPAIVTGQIPQGAEGMVYLTVDESGNYQQLDNKSLITVQGNPNETPQTIFIPSDASSQDVGNIFLAIDEAGNLINISQPAPSTSYSTESAAPEQDILAKALANTQVLQQEMEVSGALTSMSMDSTVLAHSAFNEQAQYPPTQLSNNVLETSLTLNQPIMTPLEVPSAVSSNISIPPSYTSSNLINTKQKHSMSIFPEQTGAGQASGDSVFLLDSSNNLVPAGSGSQISFQLLDGNNVIVSSGASDVLPATYQVVTSDMLGSQMIQQSDLSKNNTSTSKPENITFSILPQIDQDSSGPSEQSIILREALEGTQSNNDNLINTVEISQNDQLTIPQIENIEYVPEQIEEPIETSEHFEVITNNPEGITETEVVDQMIVETQVQHSLKRSFGEEQTVTSSSDMEDASKRIKLDER